MANVILFHHIQGLTPGVQHFGDQLRANGHSVTTPDLFEGRTFTSIESGQEYVEGVGFDTILERGRLVGDATPNDAVYAGFSLGVLSAQFLAQTRAGATGALLYHSCIPVSEFGTWPDGVPVQIHAMDADPFFTNEGDLESARDLVESVEDAELFLYPGSEHLFADDSLSSYDAAATALLLERTLAFLER
ncbi:MAG TPA: dienelactone hydrolase family protein [Acidimicrobiales bacterium]|jgi:dienelactone hydrolase